MLKLMGKEIIAILCAQTILIWTYVTYGTWDTINSHNNMVIVWLLYCRSIYIYQFHCNSNISLCINQLEFLWHGDDRQAFPYIYDWVFITHLISSLPRATCRPLIMKTLLHLCHPFVAILFAIFLLCCHPLVAILLRMAIIID